MKEIVLTNGAITIVDDWVYNWASWMPWYPHKKTEFYACTNVSNGAVVTGRRHYLHRIITNATASLEVDHINHNKLDNRECNLRLVTRGQNMAHVRSKGNTTSRYRGVHWQAQHARWVVRLHKNGKSIYVGEFQDEDEAALAYNVAAKIHHGEFAVQNEVTHA